MASTRTAVAGASGLYLQGNKYCFRKKIQGKHVWFYSDPGIGKQAAIQWMHRERGKVTTVVPVTAKFLAYANEWLPQQNISAESKANYRGYIDNHLRLIHQVKVCEITPQHIRELVIAPMKEDGKAGTTIGNVLSVLSGILATLESDGHIERNPVAKLQRGSIPKTKKKAAVILTPTQREALLEASGCLTLKTYIALGLCAGLRQSEALGLDWDDIHFDEVDGLPPHIHVHQQWMPKGYIKQSTKGAEGSANERWVGLSDRLRKILIAQRLATGGRGPVVPTRTGGRQGHRSIRTRFDNAKVKVDTYTELVDGKSATRSRLEGLEYHHLRHNFISVVAANLDLAAAQAQAGHASAEQTMHYTHELAARSSIAGAIAAVDQAFGGIV